MDILYKQIIVALCFIVAALVFGKKSVAATPVLMQENNQEDIDAENKAKLFEELAYLSLLLGAIFVFLIA